MINRSEILQTIAMIDQQHLDIRTITMGVSLLDCADTDIERSCTKVYDKICRLAGDLVRTGEDIEAEFGEGGGVHPARVVVVGIQVHRDVSDDGVDHRRGRCTVGDSVEEPPAAPEHGSFRGGCAGRAQPPLDVFE